MNKLFDRINNNYYLYQIKIMKIIETLTIFLCITTLTTSNLIENYKAFKSYTKEYSKRY